MGKNVVAVIQARTGSTRLPGKVLMDISGRPMLWHVVNRLKSCRELNEVVIATTTGKNDDVIEKYCRENGIKFYRGSEDDVLDRYYRASMENGADIVVRITSDCPLIDPGVVDKVIREYRKREESFDGACNTIERTYPRGLDTEVISFSALEKAHAGADRSYHREHVTTYIYEHPGIFNMLNVRNEEDLSPLRWTVDEEKDLQFVREIYTRLYDPARNFSMEDVVNVLRKEPHLQKINAGVKQKVILK
ncbi:MAG: glycosyltransferase family protein [Candidatus Aureabacteria bacterium]|nr:glycosyltransferase family protein [Candidatus Auribacterota bacterium]